MLKNKINELRDGGIHSLDKILVTFFCVITIRMFLDSFSYTVTNDQIFLWEHFIHGLLYFSSIFLSFSILLYLLTKCSFKTILTFLSKVSTVILAVPLIDLLVTKSRFTPLYITVDAGNFLTTFFQLMNPLSQKGITLGIYFSAYVTLIVFAHFVYKRTLSIKKVLLVIFSGYLVFFLYSILPSFILFLNHDVLSQFPYASYAYLYILKDSWMSNGLNSSSADTAYELVMARLFWLMIILQISTLIHLTNKKVWNSLKNNLRLERVVNYSLIASIGILLSQKLFTDIHILNAINLITLICFFMLIALSAWLAVFINDLEDIRIDLISNPNRPLTKKDISEKDWRIMQRYVFFMLFFGLLLMNKNVAFLLALAQCAFYVYSAQPLRLKKHFIFSSVLVGFSTVVVAMSGFFLVSPDKTMRDFPLSAALIIGISYALLSNIKDIKDYAGDKAEDIMTIPVVFGPEQSKKIIALLYMIVFISIPFLLSLQNMFIFSICASIFIYYLITKNYHEKYVFYMKFIYLIFLYIIAR